MGLIPPLAGSVTTTGRVRYLAQNAHVFATSISENVRIGCRDATESEVVTALGRAGLTIPPERVVAEDGGTLSGGEGPPTTNVTQPHESAAVATFSTNETKSGIYIVVT